MKAIASLILITLVMALLWTLCSCAVPQDGQAVITDVTDILTGQPIPASGALMAAAPSSQTHAQARAQQADNFYGGAH